MYGIWCWLLDKDRKNKINTGESGARRLKTTAVDYETALEIDFFGNQGNSLWPYLLPDIVNSLIGLMGVFYHSKLSYHTWAMPADLLGFARSSAT